MLLVGLIEYLDCHLLLPAQLQADLVDWVQGVQGVSLAFKRRRVLIPRRWCILEKFIKLNQFMYNMSICLCQ